MSFVGDKKCGQNSKVHDRLVIHNFYFIFSFMEVDFCRNPTLAKCGGEAQHLEKLEVWSPSGLFECSELNSKAQNTSHWGVLGVIGKVLKRRYQKCPRIGHSDICSPSYGQKKGRSETGSLTPDH